MENIVKKIIEIDKMASNKKEFAEQKRNEELCKIDILKKEIIQKWEEKNNLKIQQLKDEKEKIFNLKLLDIETQKKRKVDEMLKMYDQNHEKWENDLFKSIINEVCN